MDAVWQISGTGPKKPNKNAEAFLKSDTKAARPSYRASLVASDLLMRSLGRPNREQVVSERPSMLTTLQALDLSNSALLATTLDKAAPNVQKQFADKDSKALVDWLYESALSRRPTAGERKVVTDLLGRPATEQGVEDLLWVVIMLPEFQIVR